MIAWWWLIPAALVGVIAGLPILAAGAMAGAHAAGVRAWQKRTKVGHRDAGAERLADDLAILADVKARAFLSNMTQEDAEKQLADHLEGDRRLAMKAQLLESVLKSFIQNADAAFAGEEPNIEHLHDALQAARSGSERVLSNEWLSEKER